MSVMLNKVRLVILTWKRHTQYARRARRLFCTENHQFCFFFLLSECFFTAALSLYYGINEQVEINKWIYTKTRITSLLVGWLTIHKLMVRSSPAPSFMHDFSISQFDFCFSLLVSCLLFFSFLFVSLFKMNSSL